MTKTGYNSNKMNKEMHHILDHAHELVAATSGELDERIKTARAALQERLDSVKGEYGKLEDRLLDDVKAVDEFIHVKPYYAIGGTLVTGMFMGWLLTKN
jgi:ElaB/YqjD/DUF883 family membrane-anchored ribosome-binding protein